MDICKSRNIYFHGVFFSHELLRLKTLTFNFIYYTCSAYMCIAILVSTYDQIIFKSRYLQIFFYHFASQILKNLYPKTKTVTFCNFDYATLYTTCWGTKGEILHRVRHTYIISQCACAAENFEWLKMDHDTSNWELSKENVQPIRQGRHFANLNAALQTNIDHSSLKRQKQ